ncbi:MAG: hypothetical protein AAF541_11240 [Pseudomonadota bacterium]
MTRKELIGVLTQWQSGERDELAIWEWAAESVEARQANGPDADELVRDIMDLLGALPYEMVIVDDLPVFLDALENPLEETDLSINLLWNHMDAVDVDTRRLQHAEHPFYGQFTHAD